MALARVNQVVYLQNDPGQYRVGNLMFNLAGKDSHGPLATLPVPASLLNLRYVDDLNKAYAQFVGRIQQGQRDNAAAQAYFRANGTAVPDFDTSITSFLCTDEAFDIFSAGAKAFQDSQVAE